MARTDQKRYYCAQPNATSIVTRSSDERLDYWITPIADDWRTRVDWRHYRRLAIQEAVRRGLMEDPRDAPFYDNGERD